MLKKNTLFNHFLLKNRMLIANIISNIIGVVIVNLISTRAVTRTEPEIAHVAFWINLFFNPFAFISGTVLIIKYERPIRRYLNLQYHQEPIPDAILIKARQRLLNEPFFLIGLSFALWIIAAIIFPTLFRYYGAAQGAVGRVFFQSLLTGFITVTIAFFIFEYVLQKHLAPLFFPDGGIYMTPGAAHACSPLFSLVIWRLSLPSWRCSRERPMFRLNPF